MKAYFMFTAGGPLVVLTSYDSIVSPDLVGKLNSKGISKFIAHEIPVESAREKYGMHFDIVLQDLHESDDFRILDYSGERAFANFQLKELGPPIYFEQELVVSEEDV
jgi:hypothetical protein